MTRRSCSTCASACPPPEAVMAAAGAARMRLRPPRSCSQRKTVPRGSPFASPIDDTAIPFLASSVTIIARSTTKRMAAVCQSESRGWGWAEQCECVDELFRALIFEYGKFLRSSHDFREQHGRNSLPGHYYLLVMLRPLALTLRAVHSIDTLCPRNHWEEHPPSAGIAPSRERSKPP